MCGHREAAAVSGLMARFDWALMHDDASGLRGGPPLGLERSLGGVPLPRNLRWGRKAADPPATVWLLPEMAPVLSSLLGGAAPEPDAWRVVVFGGNDPRLSKVFGWNGSAASAMAERFRQHFREVAYEAKDVDLAWVATMPSGLVEHYLRRGVRQAAAAAIAHASLRPAAKPRQALAAWGKHFPKPHFRPRVLAAEWAQSAAAREAGVEVRFIDTMAWWGELAAYRFLIAPEGRAVTSAALVEALLVLVVPVVARTAPAFDDLTRRGFPLAVVDRWAEVSPAAFSEWWRTLAPRLPSFRRHCLNSDAYWRMLVGEMDHCH